MDIIKKLSNLQQQQKRGRVLVWGHYFFSLFLFVQEISFSQQDFFLSTDLPITLNPVNKKKKKNLILCFWLNFRNENEKVFIS